MIVMCRRQQVGHHETKKRHFFNFPSQEAKRNGRCLRNYTYTKLARRSNQPIDYSGLAYQKKFKPLFAFVS
jgi:hypothetical protein